MNKVLPFRKKERKKKQAQSGELPTITANAVEAAAEMMKGSRGGNTARPASPTFKDEAYNEKFHELMRLIGDIDLKPKTVDALINVLRFHEGRPTG